MTVKRIEEIRAELDHSMHSSELAPELLAGVDALNMQLTALRRLIDDQRIEIGARRTEARYNALQYEQASDHLDNLQKRYDDLAAAAGPFLED